MTGQSKETSASGGPLGTVRTLCVSASPPQLTSETVKPHPCTLLVPSTLLHFTRTRDSCLINCEAEEDSFQ